MTDFIKEILPVYERKFKELINAKKTLSKLHRTIASLKAENRSYVDSYKQSLPAAENRVIEKEQNVIVLLKLLRGNSNE